ncbi:hypothetical protein MRX96_006189 [Rhipicephalus microplus]
MTSTCTMDATPTVSSVDVSCCGTCNYCAAKQTTNSVDGALFRELFLQKLPSSVRMVIEASEQNDLPAVAELADRLVVITTPTSLAAVQEQRAQYELQQMRADISRLTETLSALRISRTTQDASFENWDLG